MPNLTSHIDLALRSAIRLAQPVLESHPGPLLLGATAPDIRILTRQGREETHFAPLAVKRVGEGVEGLFRAYPRLADASRLSEPTRAFLLGYINHLVADELWILEIYQPHFARPFANRVQADIWDRALQLELDRLALSGLGDMARVRQYLVNAEAGVEVEFIEGSTLAQWREWIVGITRREFSWERLRFMVRRLYQGEEGAMELVEQFINSLPQSLEGIYALVPREKVAAFRERSISEFIRIATEYLNVHQGSQGL